MERIRSIAVTGKGGTGKTMIATLMVKLLAERGKGKLLVIDADSAMSLPYTLGVKVERTVSDLRRGIIGKQQLKKQMESDSMREFMGGALCRGEHFDLLAMGRPEEPGCFCAVNELLRYGIDTLIGDYALTIIDGEAGPEQLNRRVLKSIDVLLVVADMSARSLETAGGILRVARKGEDGVQVKNAGLVLNRVRGDAPAGGLLEKTGLEVWARVPEDDILNEYDRAGRPLTQLPADAPSLAAVRGLLEQLVPTLL